MPTALTSENPVREHRCVDCGADLSGRHHKTQRCPSCAKKHLRQIQRQSRKRRREKEKMSHNAASGGPSSRCLYCGHEARGEDYCRFCVQEGFNEVHKMFGITNGWDKKAKPKVEVKDGVRGVLPSGNRRVYEDSDFMPRAIR